MNTELISLRSAIAHLKSIASRRDFQGFTGLSVVGRTAHSAVKIEVGSMKMPRNKTNIRIK